MATCHQSTAGSQARDNQANTPPQSSNISWAQSLYICLTPHKHTHTHTHTHNHHLRCHQSAECRCTPPSPVSHMGSSEAICHWWTPEAQHTPRRDSFDIRLTWLLRWMKAMNVRQHDFAFCSRDRKDSRVCSIFPRTQPTHLKLIHCKRLPAVLFHPGASWLKIFSEIQFNLVISRMIAKSALSCLFVHSKAKMNFLCHCCIRVVSPLFSFFLYNHNVKDTFFL